tara:strand:- start:1065 stop:1439 length:375 start_codon:yes stop_codon:yes gene_type:complete
MTNDELQGLFGFNEKEMFEFLATDYGKKTLEFLTMWSAITQKSLVANMTIAKNCFQHDDDDHVLCKFCGEGIPNWKNEYSREHSSDCPINLISDALLETKNLRKVLIAGASDVKNPMPRESNKT